MKNKLITNASKRLLLTVVARLFAGCAATRPISDVALGAGGAYLGHEISNGDPLVTAAGAASGVVIVKPPLRREEASREGFTPPVTTRARATP
jgi:hypothetical protein